MGIPMPHIHTPTTATTTSSVPEIGADLEHLTLQQLIRRKDNVEAELSALGSVLDSHNVHMTTTLTTFDGYPRSDIDVAQIRTTRARIIRLRNDHKALMGRIEKGLEGWFAEQRENPSSGQSTTAANTTSAAAAAASTSDSTPQQAPQTSHSSHDPTTGPPFALVNTVQPSSPAAQAGLLPGDKVQRFGEANYFNNEKLALVARVVGRNEGMGVDVVVLRRRGGGGGGDAGDVRDAADGVEDVREGGGTEEQVRLTLVPRSGWGGRGLLGCHLLPL